MQSFNDQANPPPIRYGCICSGISAPTLAAKHLGWKTQFFSEIEAFPRAVLQHRYPAVPLHSNFTTIQKDTYGTVDLLVGGTPCQSFSVAGKRLGLDDPRGNLALEYVSLAGRLDALWLVFENVPGLLSSAKGEDFAAFISAITGFEYRPPATGWKNAGIAEGKPGRWGIAWRVLNAEHFGVPQRRRRVFLVGYRADANWRAAAAILFEPESMRGDSAPSRKARESVAALTATGVGTCGADDNQGQAGHLIPYNIISSGQKGRNHAYESQVSGCLQHKGLAASGNEAGTLIASTGDISHSLNAGGMGRQDYETETLIAHTLRGDGFDASEDGTGRGTPLVPVCYPILEPGSRTGVSTTDPRAGIGIGDPQDPMFTLQAGKQHGIAVSCFPINTQMALRDSETSNSSREGIGLGEEGDPGFTLQANHSHAIALSLRGRDGGATAELSGETMPALRASQGGGDKPHVLSYGIRTANTSSNGWGIQEECCHTLDTTGPQKIAHASAVRRLTPEECELLQGMPQDYTRIPWRGKPASECPDGNRYKAIGNSMAVPCVSWIFDRLDFVHRSLLQMEKAV